MGCLVVPIHISDVISLKSDLLREKLYLFKSSTLSNSTLHSVSVKLASISSFSTSLLIISGKVRVAEDV